MMREALVGAVRLGWPQASVSEAGDFPGAWVAAAMRPGLILCDLGMPGAEPLEGIRGVMAASPGTPVLVVTGLKDDTLLLALFDLGIAGFLPKESRSVIIEAAIRLILAGGRYLPPRVIELATARGSGALPSSVRPDDVGAAKLTLRQISVLDRMAKGATNKEIARDFNISPATVKAHAMAAFSALGVTTRTEAVSKAIALGAIQGS
jgi:two-component system, NarL family, nitrate/nitrite response regulator NarL